MQDIFTLPEDVQSIRKAQSFLMGGEKTPLKATLKSTALPDSVIYLHSLVAKSLGDSYNYYDNQFVVKIQPADHWRFPQLKGIVSVMLEYRNGEQ